MAVPVRLLLMVAFLPAAIVAGAQGANESGELPSFEEIDR